MRNSKTLISEGPVYPYPRVEGFQGKVYMPYGSVSLLGLQKEGLETLPTNRQYGNRPKSDFRSRSPRNASQKGYLLVPERLSGTLTRGLEAGTMR